MTYILAVLLFVIPYGIIVLSEKFPVLKKIGILALCYLIGIVVSASGLSYDKSLIQTIAYVLVALAIPLILFGFDWRMVRSLTRKMTVGFLLQIVSVALVAAIAFFIMQKMGMAHGSYIVGMMSGLYTGGTPNLIAVGQAIIPRSIAPALITSCNTADMLVGGVYYLLMITTVPKIYRKLLGDGRRWNEKEVQTDGQKDYTASELPKDKQGMRKLILIILLALGCLAAGIGLEYLISGNLDGSLYIIVTVSLLGIVFSFIPAVREVPGSYKAGQYLMYVFSLGLSMSLNFSEFTEAMLPVLILFAIMQVSCTVIHFILCRIAGLDGGCALITNVAGIYGPPFIAPAAEAYGEKKLIVPGMICGVIGLCIGTFFGIAVGLILA